MVFRRDILEKDFMFLEGLVDVICDLFDVIYNDMFEKVRKYREDNIFIVENMDEFRKVLEEKLGFIKIMWCGDVECEVKIKEEIGVIIRCLFFE